MILARTRDEWREIPERDLMAATLNGPALVFDDAAPDLVRRFGFHPELCRDDLADLRRQFHREHRVDRRITLAADARVVWRRMVNHAVGYRPHPAAEWVPWPTVRLPRAS